MRYALAPFVHVALVDQRAVVLDIGKDRYRLVGRRGAGAIAQLVDTGRSDDQEAVAMLVDQGVLAETMTGSVILVSRSANRSALTGADLDGSELTTRTLAIRVIAAVASLRFRGLQRTLAAAASRKAMAGPLEADEARIIRLARDYSARRGRVPLRRICLRDAISLFRILVDARLECELVFGVRLDPFGAHSWVQSGDLVLSDELDMVRPMTPILVL